MNLDAEFLVYVLGKVLRAVDGAVLASCAPEAEHQVGEATLDVAAYMLVGEGVHIVKKFQYLAVVLKESYHGLVKASQLLVWLIASGVVRGAAVEHIAASVS